jgi:hypothetical protein
MGITDLKHNGFSGIEREGPRYLNTSFRIVNPKISFYRDGKRHRIFRQVFVHWYSRDGYCSGF